MFSESFESKKEKIAGKPRLDDRYLFGQPILILRAKMLRFYYRKYRH